MKRREFIHRSAILSAVTGAHYFLMPGLAQGRSHDTSAPQNKLIWVLLRGGLDSLAALVPYGDSDYAEQRQGLALSADGLHKLDGTFALHPSLSQTAQLYRQGHLALLPAVATSYRERSHFDGQKVIENGVDNPGLKSGWLNRALPYIRGDALAVGQAIPLVLQGERRVNSWAPSFLTPPTDSTLEMLGQLYSNNPDFSQRLLQALEQNALAEGSDMDNVLGVKGRARKKNAGQLFAKVCRATARLMTAEGGPQVAALEFNGWDTHANQGREQGRLAALLHNLDGGLAALKDELGASWQQTVVIVASEFGRTVSPNGTQGTDHGTAGLALAAGGAIKGSKILGNWPGLSHQYEKRDLYPANHLHSLLTTVLADHMGVPKDAFKKIIFPATSGLGRLQIV